MATYHFSNRPHATLKSGEKMNVKTHYEYICREGKYSHMRDRSQESLVAVSYGNMPSWTYDSAKGKIDARKFWAEDEKHRGTNGRGYRELHIALMEELSNEENKELVETFLKRSGIKDNHAYSYAIHDKTAAFDKNHRNIHAHIMFNEKIIEQDRPLSADMYFKKYSVKKDLTPIGGYKVSRYFSSREATLDMRQLWEDIVNEKFKEKGIPTRVSCKSLREQKREAEEQQDYLTAGFLDRKSAPNIGSSYRNPETMQHIQELVHTFTETMQDPLYTEGFDKQVESLEEDSKERSLILFAQDLALRNMARQIKEQHAKELQEAKARAIEAIRKKEQEEATLAIEEAPWAVTIQDVMDFVEEKNKTIDKSIETLYNKYDSIHVLDLTKEKAVMLAMNHFTNGKYEQAKLRLKVLNNKYLSVVEQETKYLENKNFSTAEDYTQYLKERRQLKEEIDEKEKELAEMENLLVDPINEPKIRDIANQIWDTNLQQKEKRNNALLEITKAESAQSILEDEYNSLKEQSPTKLLYISGIPAIVTRKDKLRGTIPLRELTPHVFGGKQYLSIDKETDKGKAILLNDTTVDGSAKIYELTFEKDAFTNKNRIRAVQDTGKTIPLYQTYSSLLEAVNALPELTATYKEKLERIRKATELEYDKMFKPEEKTYIKEKEKERLSRNKDPDDKSI